MCMHESTMLHMDIRTNMYETFKDGHYKFTIDKFKSWIGAFLNWPSELLPSSTGSSHCKGYIQTKIDEVEEKFSRGQWFANRAKYVALKQILG